MSTMDVPFETIDGHMYSYIIVAALWHKKDVDELIAGCVSELTQNGVREENIRVERVPGAYELPVAASAAAQSKKYNAVICFGVVIRGETAHFEFVASPVAHALQNVAITTGVPCIFGVLTTENHEQVVERLGGIHGHKGKEAAQAALMMANVIERL